MRLFLDYGSPYWTIIIGTFISSATVRVQHPLLRQTLTEFGQYVAEMLPKYVQKVEVTNCEELDIMIHPEGVIPTLQFLKDHHNAQFLNIIDIAGMDVPAREYRFEVMSNEPRHEKIGLWDF